MGSNFLGLITAPLSDLLNNSGLRVNLLTNWLYLTNYTA